MSKYLEGELIGAGTYAKVYKGIDSETGGMVALKRIALVEKEGMPSTALREISILRGLKHENIISILQVIHTEELLTIVFEYMEYDLMKYISSHKNVLFLINQLISGIHHIHSHNIVHRDLKPHNILVDSEGVLKIADFGLARSLGATDFPYSSEVVTLWYRAPELLMGATGYGCEIDIWSLGCIMYEMICKKPLVAGENNLMQLTLCKQLDMHKLKGELSKDYGIPWFLVDVLVRCLSMSPKKRITADEIVEYLERAYSNIGN